MNGLKKRKFDNSILAIVAYGLIAGVATGGVLSLFLVCAKVLWNVSFGLLRSMRDIPLAAVCAVTLCLICCLLTAVIQTLVPGSKGSGIPLAEGAARGMLRVGWLRSAAALIAGSLLSFACGMPLGSEGPSVAVGGLMGEGVGKLTRRLHELRRYLITGGSSAGLAAAFNAPLTGLCFAFEETHRRFSPNILAAALSAVISAVAVTQVVFFGFSHIPYLAEIGVRAGVAPFAFLEQTAPVGLDILWLCLIALVAGALCAALGTAFDRAVAALSGLTGKIRSTTLRLLPAFLLAAVLVIVMPGGMGSGERLVEYSTSLMVHVIAVALLLRFVSTIVAGGCGATGGLFVPMIVIGALFGGIVAFACNSMGLDDDYTTNIVVLCICAFFASSVRAPVTAIVMSFELTASFVNLLPCAIAVAAATVITDLTKTEPLYEKALERLIDCAPAPQSLGDITVTGLVRENSPVAHKHIRNILWQYNSLIVELKRDGVVKVPDGETVLLPGDELTVRAENVDKDCFLSVMSEYLDVDAPPAAEPPIHRSGYSAAAKNKK